MVGFRRVLVMLSGWASVSHDRCVAAFFGRGAIIGARLDPTAPQSSEAGLCTSRATSLSPSSAAAN